MYTTKISTTMRTNWSANIAKLSKRGMENVVVTSNAWIIMVTFCGEQVSVLRRNTWHAIN